MSKPRTSHPPRPLAKGRLFLLSPLVAAALAAGLAGCGSSSPTSAVQIRTLNNRADLVSGGDALVEVVLPAGGQAGGLKVDVDGRDVSSAFAVRADGRITGVVTGLASGSNVITARTDNTLAASLTVTNAPRGGPVLSGAQITPFVCATPTPQPATADLPATNASGLGTAATDAQCNTATEMRLYYKTTAANCSFALPDPSATVAFTATTVQANPSPAANLCFKPYTVGSTPADMASTTTDHGVTVPYIVRVERGTMNRGIYDIAVLFDPAKPWTATAPQAQWNGKLLYQFGASTGQPRRQVRPATAWTDDKSLSRGYMVVANSMTDSAINSNRVMMAETVMMMKEHIGDTYGPVRFTMGSGCSGGSINSNMNASIAPGQLDGITISCAYPDSETTGIEVMDCSVLVEAYDKPAWKALMTAGGLSQTEINTKKAAINGHRDHTGCQGWFNAFGSNGKAGVYQQRLVANQLTGALATNPVATNNCQLPNSKIWNASTNPGGARCSAWDWAASVFGKGADGRALQTRDNVGVQYGLKALLAGAISAEEFVTLNELTGGVDADSNLTAARSPADTAALEIAYRAGIVMDPRQYTKTAVIDMRGYDDSLLDLPPGLVGLTADQIQFRVLFGIHQHWRSFSIRDRLDKAVGDHGNHVMWRFGRSGFAAPAAMNTEAFLTMDSWLSKLAADTSANPVAAKVRSAKPASATDWCLLSSDAAQATKVSATATCDADPYLKPMTSPRQVAGGPLTEDILKCQLKPLNAADYGGRLDSAQLARLQAVFPSGVCDWAKPGVGQQAAASPLSFRAGPGGQALGPAPVSAARP